MRRITIMKLFLFLLPLLLLAGCGLEAEYDLGGGETHVEALGFEEVAPLLMLWAVCLLLLVQAPLLTWWRAAHRRSRHLFTAALLWYGFIAGLSLLPLCFALYSDTFYPRIAGPFNLGYAFAVFWCCTCPMMFAGILLVVVITLCRWWWLVRQKA